MVPQRVTLSSLLSSMYDISVERDSPWHLGRTALGQEKGYTRRYPVFRDLSRSFEIYISRADRVP